MQGTRSQEHEVAQCKVNICIGIYRSVGLCKATHVATWEYIDLGICIEWYHVDLDLCTLLQRVVSRHARNLHTWDASAVGTLGTVVHDLFEMLHRFATCGGTEFALVESRCLDFTRR